jgi:hypothetical protein
VTVPVGDGVAVPVLGEVPVLVAVGVGLGVPVGVLGGVELGVLVGVGVCVGVSAACVSTCTKLIPPQSICGASLTVTAAVPSPLTV